MSKTCGECQWFHWYPNDLASKGRCNMFFFRDRGNNPACDRFVACLNAPAEARGKMSLDEAIRILEDELKEKGSKDDEK